MTKAPTAVPSPERASAKRAFWIPDELYEKIRTFVGRHKNEPENMSINGFVRDALDAHLEASTRKEKRR